MRRVFLVCVALCAVAGRAGADESALAQLGALSDQPVSPIRGELAALKSSVNRARRPLEPDGYKPSGLAGRAEARKMCSALSRQAAARGVATLVVGFEGLLSFDAPGTSAAYRYQLGLGPKPPPFFVPALGGGYLLHGLMLPLVDEYRSSFEFLVFRHTEQLFGDDSVPAVCARIWARGAPAGVARRIVIAGHSAGGLSASLLALSLEHAGVPVDLLVTIDAMPAPIPRPGNVRRWENYRQNIPLPAPGVYVPDADLNKTIWTTNHFSIPGDPAVVGSVTRQVGRMIRGGQAARPQASTNL